MTIIDSRNHKAIHLSIVIPIYNEEEFLQEVVENILGEVASKIEESFELILVENGSRDKTLEVANNLANLKPEVIQVLSLPKPDYGRALRAGFQTARGVYIANFDLDYWNVDFVCDALGFIDNLDLVIASKNLPNSDDRRNCLRRLNTWGFQKTLHFLFDFPYHDTHGIKLWRRSVVEQLLPSVHFDRDLFDTEMILRGVQAGWRVKEVPIVVEEKRRPRLSIVSRIARTFRDLVKLRALLKQ